MSWFGQWTVAIESTWWSRLFSGLCQCMWPPWGVQPWIPTFPRLVGWLYSPSLYILPIAWAVSIQIQWTYNVCDWWRQWGIVINLDYCTGSPSWGVDSTHRSLEQRNLVTLTISDLAVLRWGPGACQGLLSHKIPRSNAMRQLNHSYHFPFMSNVSQNISSNFLLKLPIQVVVAHKLYHFKIAEGQVQWYN